MPNTYVDCITYIKQPTGLAQGPLPYYYGNMARIGATAQGATSLTVPATTVALNEYDAIYVFDGANSEELLVGPAGAAQGVTTIPLLNPTQYAHAAGTPYCTDGTQGSLGEQIFTASKWIEDGICFQPLWATTYTGEILTMPTMRAAIDNQQNIHFRPRHFPITAFTSISIQDVRKNVYPLDQTQATIDSDQQTVDIPVNALNASQSQSQQGYPYTYGFNRRATAWLILTYTAGFSALPYTVRRACTLLTSQCFVQLENPVGADQITQGKRSVTFAIRGDTSGESELVKEAKSLLQAYTAESF